MIKVESEYVVRYHKSWIEGNTLYIQMDLCAGSLQNILDVRYQAFDRQHNEPMDCIEYYFWCEIFKEILEAVQYLHELHPPVIHRDLKPDNILISSYNKWWARNIKLCDFGLATVHDRAIHEMTFYKHSSDVGTLAYQAPEVGQGFKYNHKVDVYSLAIIASKMFDIDLCELYLDEYVHKFKITGNLNYLDNFYNFLK